MSENSDKIGVVRQHRWMNAEKQAELLGPRCNKVVSLGGKGARLIEREDLEKLARPGTVLEFVHAFLLADPKRKRVRGGMKADFRAALERLEKRGAVVVDVDASICSRKHKRALLALVDADIGRSNQGLKSALNGARSKGKPKGEFSPEQYEKAEAIWGNTKRFKNWNEADAALRLIKAPDGQEFTAYRAHAKWGGRR